MLTLGQKFFAHTPRLHTFRILCDERAERPNDDPDDDDTAEDNGTAEDDDTADDDDDAADDVETVNDDVTQEVLLDRDQVNEEQLAILEEWGRYNETLRCVAFNWLEQWERHAGQWVLSESTAIQEHREDTVLRGL